MRKTEYIKIRKEILIPFTTPNKTKQKHLMNIFTSSGRSSLDVTRENEKNVKRNLFSKQRYSDSRMKNEFLYSENKIHTYSEIKPKLKINVLSNKIQKSPYEHKLKNIRNPESIGKLQKIQTDLICKLKKLDYDNIEKRPSKERISAVLEALQKICEEKSIFQDYMQKIIDEIKRAIYFSVGEFPMLFNFSKIDCEGIF